VGNLIERIESRPACDRQEPAMLPANLIERIESIYKNGQVDSKHQPFMNLIERIESRASG
jgi:hypothetical protein